MTTQHETNPTLKSRPKDPTGWGISLAHGLLGAAGMVLYFFLMKLLGWAETPELRALNLFIMAGVVGTAIRKYKHSPRTESFTYFKAFGFGLRTAAVAVFSFAAFMAFYFWLVAPNMLNVVTAESMYTGSVTPMFVFFVLTLEGMISGLILTFIFLQWYKNPIKTFHLRDKMEIMRNKERRNDVARDPRS